MSTYIALCKWTTQGVETVKDSPDRLEAFKKLLKKRGLKFRSFYLTFGRYDFVTIFEANDDAKAASVLLHVASLGNITTETLKAFDEDEYRKVIKSV